MTRKRNDYSDKNDKSFLIGDDLFWIFEGNKYYSVRVFLPFLSAVFKCDKKEPLQNIIRYFQTYTKEETIRHNKLIAETNKK